jgi:hypothetical protein
MLTVTVSSARADRVWARKIRATSDMLHHTLHADVDAGGVPCGPKIQVRRLVRDHRFTWCGFASAPRSCGDGRAKNHVSFFLDKFGIADCTGSVL